MALQNSLRNLVGSTADDCEVEKSRLVAVLTESAEKIDEKDAEMYLKEMLNGKIVEKISLSELTHKLTARVSECTKICN